MYIADLHIHSRFSRATSREGDLPHLDLWARRKGIGLVGTGDFTHPAWRAELKEQLVPAGEGVYTLREDLRLPGEAPGEAPRFVVTGEISSIYKRGGRTRKVHNLLLLPNLEAADALAARLEAIGNLHSDGRPILGLDSRDLLELLLETCPEGELVPAHIWTPHFSLFGAFSGFDTLEECFGDLAGHIHGVETGLSSDPPMNWRVPALDRLQLLSNSDAHSPAKLGREANLLEGECSYPALLEAVRTGRGLAGTVEFFPEEGKYHLDGHRNCGVCLTPAQTTALQGVCPVCGKKLTIGVEHRVEELSGRPEGARPDSAKPFERLAPLPEVIAASTGTSPTAKATLAQYERLLRDLGPEFSILRQAPLEEVARTAGPCVAEGLRRLRAGQAVWRPGFDGEYGVLTLLTPAEIQQLEGQTSFFAAEAPSAAPAARRGAKLAQPAAAAPQQQRAVQGEGLNPAQQAAAAASERVVAVVAGPGTGKTKTLAARVLYLVRERGVRPEEITAVTFTRQAAEELRHRLGAVLGKRAAAKLTIGTFHALCWELLGRPKLVSQGDALTAAGRLLAQRKEKGAPRMLLQQVSRVKNGLLEEEQVPLYGAYCAALEGMGALDFDDLLLRAFQQEVAGQRRFRHLLVDEFQDVNALQYALVDRWSRAGESLFVIGDPDQSIYGFRGASAGWFQRLADDRPGTRLVRLEENYRSTPEILAAAAPVIARNPGGPRVLRAQKPSGTAVRLVRAADELAQGIFIAKEIGRMAGGVDMLEAQALGQEREPRAFSEIAVLCRTHRQLELVEKCLRHDDIPCVVSGREEFLEDPQVRGVLAFLHTLEHPADAPALETALTALFGCPADLVCQAQRACEGQDSLHPEALSELAAGYGPLELWLKRAAAWLPLEGEPWRLVERWEALYGATPALDRLRNMAVFHPTWDSLWETLTLGQEADLRRAAGPGWKSGAVRLMTLHGSKGLEFPAVFLAGLQAGMLPLEPANHSADLEEERRLFYVGMTRAREELILTAAPPFSSFLEELPDGVLRQEIGRPRPAQQLSWF